MNKRLDFNTVAPWSDNPIISTILCSYLDALFFFFFYWSAEENADNCIQKKVFINFFYSAISRREVERKILINDRVRICFENRGVNLQTGYTVLWDFLDESLLQTRYQKNFD